MSKQSKSFGVRDIVLVALFAAVTYLGISALRIPLPAAVGAPFIHFGNSLLVLSVLLLGGFRGGLAGAIGLGLFDLLNGYASTAPVTVILAFLVAAIVSGAFTLLKHQDSPLNIFILALVAGVSKIALEFLHGLIEKLLLGSAFTPAVVAAFTSLPATAINAISTVIIVTVLYFPLKRDCRSLIQTKGSPNPYKKMV
ncbi:substrate-specific component PdxU of predicted pyridoxine ECF transporter [Sporolactobacillus inulinus]|uniref:Substrate-specific component PdxU of predicted pyridoxine ECF transporter n=1 Tax=Sporolactobacillus inulinus TaxID=2078 RepID=A0A4Y1ZDF5_9BACL|nr:ECF transporter S component [Sporolactobacillus inulinus]GAY77127.1 substrate-specific component PdxU of predicted pyridoxine ECF transporter [Sporolactobacillus inulinus]